MPVVASRPDKRTWVAAVAAVAATYAYFLLFAQFGFLKALQVAAGEEQRVIKPVLAVMGVSGIVASVGAAWIVTKRWASFRGTLTAGLTLCFAASALTAAGLDGRWFQVIAALIGLGVGVTTVTLAAGLRSAVGIKPLGLVIGLGTGLAYAFCNLPAIFTATASCQAWWSVGISAIGVLAVQAHTCEQEGPAPDSFDFSKTGVGLWTLLFSTLVGLDSAAFYVIQHTPSLKALAWSGDGRLALNAVIHLVAAALAGVAFDRQWLGRMMAVAAALLIVASAMLGQSKAWFEWSTMGYPAAVSIYSVALVFYAASSGRPWIAAWIYAIAGWGGSAVGIGLVENLHGLSFKLITVAGIVMAIGLLFRGFKVRATRSCL